MSDKNVPELRFPGFEDCYIKTKIDNYCTDIIDCVNKTASTTEKITPYRMIRTSNIRNGKIDLSEVRYVEEDTYKVWTRRGVPLKGDLILTREAPVGEIGIVTDEDGIFLGQRTIMYRLNPQISDSTFALYSFQTRRIRKQLDDYSNGGTVAHIRVPDCSKFNFFFPSLLEQQKIASFLSDIDKKIDLLTRKKELMEQYKKGMMQKLFSRELRFKDENGEDFPDWEENPLSEIGSTFSGLTGKKSGDFGTGKPYITYKSVFDNSKIDVSKFDFVNIHKNEKQNKVKYGDILFTLSSETPEEVGFVSAFLEPNIEEVYLNSFCFGFRLYDNSLFSPDFLRFFFRSSIFRKAMFKLAQGSTRYNMSKNELLKLSFYFPSIKEQKKISNLLTLIENNIDQLNSGVDIIKNFKKGLLQKMFV